MSTVEIEEAISTLAEQPFDSAEFPYAFLWAFRNKETTLKRLRKGASNKSDLGAILQAKTIHPAVISEGQVAKTLSTLRDIPAITKAKFALTTDEVIEKIKDGSVKGHLYDPQQARLVERKV